MTAGYISAGLCIAGMISAAGNMQDSKLADRSMDIWTEVTADQKIKV